MLARKGKATLHLACINGAVGLVLPFQKGKRIPTFFSKNQATSHLCVSLRHLVPVREQNYIEPLAEDKQDRSIFNLVTNVKV